MNIESRYLVLNKARTLADDPQLDYLESRKYIGEPLGNDVRNWLRSQPTMCPIAIDFHGVRAVNASVAEEMGPMLLQSIQQSAALEHRYPVFALDTMEMAYTFARAFDHSGSTGLALVKSPDVEQRARRNGAPADILGGHLSDMESTSLTYVILELKHQSVVLLGQLSKQMIQILELADARARDGSALTSEDLISLPFLADKSAAARSKRLTELYARRLLAFEENPVNAKERLFKPIWHL